MTANGTFGRSGNVPNPAEEVPGRIHEPKNAKRVLEEHALVTALRKKIATPINAVISYILCP